MNTNPLNKYPKIREYLYLLQWVVNGVLAVAAVVFLVQGTDLDDVPKWYAYAVAIGPVLWTYLGITAQTNVTPDLPDEYTLGEVDDGLTYEEAGGLPFDERVSGNLSHYDPRTGEPVYDDPSQ